MEPSLKLPDITPAQIVSVVGAIIAVAVAFGAPIPQDAQDAILQLVTILAPILLIADAAIRHGRSRALGVPPRPPIEGSGEPEPAPAPAPAPAAEPAVAYENATPHDRAGI